MPSDFTILPLMEVSVKSGEGHPSEICIKKAATAKVSVRQSNKIRFEETGLIENDFFHPIEYDLIGLTSETGHCLELC
jgi:hypothetical protein